jgi:hypothetical protein
MNQCDLEEMPDNVRFNWCDVHEAYHQCEFQQWDAKADEMAMRSERKGFSLLEERMAEAMAGC